MNIVYIWTSSRGWYLLDSTRDYDRIEWLSKKRKEKKIDELDAQRLTTFLSTQNYNYYYIWLREKRKRFKLFRNGSITGNERVLFFPPKIAKKLLIRKKAKVRSVECTVSNVVTWAAWVVFHCFISSIETNGCPSPVSGGFLINCPG